MKFKRKAKAHWSGSGKEGSGTLSTDSGVLDETPYSFHTRFEDGTKGTNPEELVGAAHSGCFAMQLSFLLGEEGFQPETLDVVANVLFEDGSITEVTLNLTASIPEISSEKFTEIAQKAKNICPISKLLDTKINLITNLK
ncbi:OsmC family protein [Aquimarina brevivitae]|uniref:Osmotically inducible protein OsmC n=1 Tax=Aquimarina brevivitae TaxID=323412 RepID=A0A4Q7P507_9FLAO|nr:OsmC family protein [Aquimarina brevivitae]RZS93792.1 osmotically inducible protein OsmC [Aquimarina brevivitae]